MVTQRHGWVTPLPYGAKARCGGPGICKGCQEEVQASKRHGESGRGARDIQMLSHQPRPEPDASNAADMNRAPRR